MTTILIANFKGGVAKTTTTCNLAYGLASMGFKVGVVDTDPQGHCSHLLGTFDESGNPHESLYTLITTEARFRPSMEALTINIPVGSGSIRLLPGGKLTAIAAVNMEIRKMPITTLRDLLQPLAQECDVLLMDTPPTIGLMTPQSLAVADWVLLPTDLASMDVGGVDAMIYAMAEDAAYHQADVLGIVPTKIHPRDGEDRIQAELLVQKYGDRVWMDTPIHFATAWKQAAAVSASIFELCKPSHKPYQQMEALVNKFAGAVLGGGVQ